MIFKKILWAIKRHPFLYATRFKLLSRNSSIEEITTENYNNNNRKKDIPKKFYKINDLIFKEVIPIGDLDKVKQIANWLHDNIKAGPGLSEPSEKVLDIMLSGKGGVCSDMSQIFNNFCVVNDISVREWGVTRAPFDRSYGGHSFNEVYCKEYKKWVLFDAYWCVYYLDNDDIPLSVDEFYLSVREKEHIKTEIFYKVPFLERNGYEKNYFHLNCIPFLICNYSNKRYDRLLKLTRPLIPVFISHFLLYILFLSYHYKFPIDNYRAIFE